MAAVVLRKIDAIILHATRVKPFAKVALGCPERQCSAICSSCGVNRVFRLEFLPKLQPRSTRSVERLFGFDIKVKCLSAAASVAIRKAALWREENEALLTVRLGIWMHGPSMHDLRLAALIHHLALTEPIPKRRRLGDARASGGIRRLSRPTSHHLAADGPSRARAPPPRIHPPGPP